MTNSILDQKEIENKWQKFWDENKTFEASFNDSKEKFFSTVPYPYANSVLHIGHGRSYTAADILTRYQRLKGKNVLFPMAYHISGTPVLAVADGIKRGDEKQLKLTKDALSDYITDERELDKVITSFEDPQNIASFFSKTIETSLRSIGVGIDWRRQFTTGEDLYNKFVEWQYKKLQEAGILVQGKYPILYSPQDGNAVGEDDIKDGDTDKVSTQEMTFIKFKFTDSDDYLVAATLRPDSLFGATNLYVKKDMELCRVEVEGDVWVVAKDAIVKIEHQFDKVEVLEELLGETLLNKQVIVPITNKEVPIMHADFPDSSHGTGIVYSSPADSPHDYINLFEIRFPGKTLDEFDSDPLELSPITQTFDKKGNEIKYKDDIPAYDTLLKFSIVETQGNEEKLEEAKQHLYKEAHYGAKMINCGEFDGTPIKFGQPKVKEKLIELGLGGLYFETSRRAKTRAGDTVIVANLEGQWFLDYSSDEVKSKAYSLLENMSYFPKQLRDTQQGYLKWVSMRPCARKRGIGTKLPMDPEWIIEPLSDSTIYQMLYLVMHIIRRENISPEQLTSDTLDYVLLGEGNVTLLSEQIKVSKEVLEEMRSEVEYWKSFDMRYTAAPHLSNHLSFLIYHYALIFSKEYHPRNITVGGLLIKDGHKISKSKGNGIPLSRVKDIYGVDLYRLYIAVASNIEAEMDFKDDEIKQLEKRFNKFKELMFSAKELEKPSYESLSSLQKWLVSKFYSRVEKYFEAMEEKKVREAYVGILYEVLNDIPYLQRRSDEKSTIGAVRFILEDYVKLMTPVVPHTCEEIYENLGEGAVSLESFTTELTKFRDLDLESKEGILENLLTSVIRIKERDSKEVSKVILIQAKNSRFELFDKLTKVLEETRDFKQIMQSLSEFDDKKFIQKFVPKTLGEGLSFYLPKEQERDLLREFVPFLEEEFSLKVEIIDADTLEQSSSAIIPSEPGVLLE